MMEQFEDPPTIAERACRDPVESDLSEVDCPAPEAAGDEGAKPDGKVSIFTLGHLDIRQNGRSVLPQRKLPRKPVALLLLLIANGVQGSRREALVECLWPGDDRADASRLKVALHRLRQLMGDSAAILSHASAIRINADRVTVDAWELEQLASSGLDPEASARRALALYAGPFVADIAADPSLLIYQQHLESQFDGAMLAGVQAMTAAGKGRQALELALQGLMRIRSEGHLLSMARELAKEFGGPVQSAALEAYGVAIERGCTP